jgi:putative membrane protein
MQLTPQDRTRIETAIAQAESRTSGEIAVVIAQQSGDWRAASLAISIAVSFLATLVLWQASVVTYFPALWLIQLATFLSCETLLQVTGFAPRLVGSEALQKAAARHAQSTFYAQGIHHTRDRAGILLFVSLQERYVELIADEGIRQKIPAETWHGIVTQLIAQMRQGQGGTGFETAIRHCGELLAAHFPATGKNTDELPNIVQLA